MKKIIAILSLLITTFSVAQNETIIGEKFNFDTKGELDPQFVLVDNYNHFLVSTTISGGIGPENYQINVRKFDQKNNLVETISKNFKIDITTLHNYHGVYELDANKIAIIIESYSGKRKIAEIFSYVFDKTTGQFTTKVIATYPIESAFKSGNLYVSKSQNKNYISVVYQKKSSKKEPEESDCILLDAHSLEKVWQKTATFQDEFNSTFRTVTNTGKIIFVRAPRSYKETNYLVVIDNEKQEVKSTEENIKLHQPLGISIGQKDYLIAFNHTTKGVRRGDFGNILFYDLEQGKTLFNNDVTGFSINNMKEVIFSNIFIESNEIRVVAEGLSKVDIKPVPGSTTFMEDKFNYGPASILIFSNEGELKKQVKIETNDANREASLYHSFGLFNNKGNYYINTGLYNVNLSNRYGYYKLDTSKNYESTTINFNYIIDNEYSFRSVNQLFKYNNDTNKVLFTRTTRDNKMFFISLPLVK